jgi:hypothetical protein
MHRFAYTRNCGFAVYESGIFTIPASPATCQQPPNAVDVVKMSVLLIGGSFHLSIKFLHEKCHDQCWHIGKAVEGQDMHVLLQSKISAICMPFAYTSWMRFLNAIRNHNSNTTCTSMQVTSAK